MTSATPAHRDTTTTGTGAARPRQTLAGIEIDLAVTDDEGADDSATESPVVANVLPTAAFTEDCNDLIHGDCLVNPRGEATLARLRREVIR